EQNRVGIHDVAHYAYPTFARAAMQRRDNLKVSIRELEGNLERARDELSMAVEDLKKVELLEERDHSRERDARDAAEQVEMDEIALRRRLR
ncbi:flagellar FliJ family protein, partial [Mycobacterium tuberculosis]|nr:flagellar FliJ family protein [Mycobacterium tuberculosis]